MGDGRGIVMMAEDIGNGDGDGGGMERGTGA